MWNEGVSRYYELVLTMRTRGLNEGQTRVKRVFTEPREPKESLYEAYLDIHSALHLFATEDRRMRSPEQFCFQYVPQFYEVETEGIYVYSR